jgi:NMD protein affecting ribosome stability and mRNA decay
VRESLLVVVTNCARGNKGVERVWTSVVDLRDLMRNRESEELLEGMKVLGKEYERVSKNLSRDVVEF